MFQQRRKAGLLCRKQLQFSEEYQEEGFHLFQLYNVTSVSVQLRLPLKRCGGRGFTVIYFTTGVVTVFYYKDTEYMSPVALR